MKRIETIKMSVRVRVPASSANLGPGFDALGLALNLYNYVTLEESGERGDDEPRVSVRVSGEGAKTLTGGEENIAIMAVRHLWRWAGYETADTMPFHLSLENAIPLSRGLGSSAAARVGALVAANEWVRQQGMETGKRVASRAELVTLATQLEGHPDNVAPALLGGLVASAKIEEENEIGALAVPLHIEKFPRLLVFIPDSELATSQARGVLPDTVSRADATFNVSRTALLMAALTGERWDVLGEALQDRLHQNQRAQLMPGFLPILQAAREAGAYGATLSGAGPTVLAWLPHDETIVREVQAALENAAAQHEVLGHVREVEVDRDGCVVV
jgi:homoserine kinase